MTWYLNEWKNYISIRDTQVLDPNLAPITIRSVGEQLLTIKFVQAPYNIDSEFKLMCCCIGKLGMFGSCCLGEIDIGISES